LDALEENNYTSLPPDPYAYGIVKRCAEFLELDQQKVLALYKRQKGINKHVKKQKTYPMPRPLSNPRIIVTPKTYLIILIIFVFLSVSVYIAYQFHHFAAPPKLIINYPPDNITVETSSITIEGKTDAHADLSINQQHISVENNGNFRSVVNLQNGVNSIKITTKNRINKEKSVVRKILAKLPKTTAKNEKSTVRAPLELLIQINPNSAWLYIETDNKQTYQGIMLPGANQVFQANEYISITTRNGGSVEITFNGKNLGKLGTEGEIIKGLKFDRNTKVE